MGFFDNKNTDEMQESVSVEKELRRAKMFGWRDVVICLLIVGFFLLTKNTFRGYSAYGGFSPVLEETQFGIVGLDGETHSFVYAEAESIELRDDLKTFDKGEKVSGEETRRACSGVYRNAEFGEYQLHVLSKLKNYIVVRNADGVLVFNIEADETTKALYDYFMEQRAAQMK